MDSTQWFSGIFLIEDLDTIEHGLASGSWIETGLGGLALSLDAISTIANPLEAVVSWGVAWLLEHVEPLSDALEVLAGDADQIMAFSQTWSNVGNSITAAGVNLRGAIDRETIDWTGAAAEAYRGHMNEELGAMVSLAKAASVLGQVVLGAGLLVSCVRQMVRDSIAQFVGVLAGALPLAGRGGRHLRSGHAGGDRSGRGIGRQVDRPGPDPADGAGQEHPQPHPDRAEP